MRNEVSDNIWIQKGSKETVLGFVPWNKKANYRYGNVFTERDKMEMIFGKIITSNKHNGGRIYMK